MTFLDILLYMNLILLTCILRFSITALEPNRPQCTKLEVSAVHTERGRSEPGNVYYRQLG